MNKKFQIFSSIYRGFIIKTFKAFNNLTKLNFSENSYRIASKINKELFSSSNIFQANYSSFTLAYALAKFNRNIFNTYFSIFNSLIFFENHNIIFNLFQNLDLIYSSSNDSHFNYHILYIKEKITNCFNSFLEIFNKNEFFFNTIFHYLNFKLLNYNLIFYLINFYNYKFINLNYLSLFIFYNYNFINLNYSFLNNLYNFNFENFINYFARFNRFLARYCFIEYTLIWRIS